MAFILSFYYSEIYLKGILIFLTIATYGILTEMYKPFKVPSKLFSINFHIFIIFTLIMLGTNKIDHLSSLTTGVSIIVGLLMYKNPYDYWKYSALILLGTFIYF